MIDAPPDTSESPIECLTYRLKREEALTAKLQAELKEARTLAFYAEQALGGLNDPRRWDAGRYLCQIIMPKPQITGDETES